MAIEKKLVALSVLAITIGIATVVPLAFFMTAEAQTYPKYDEPWFNINVPFAFFKADLTDGIYQDLCGLPLQVAINYNAFNSQTDARVEYLELTLYTDDLQLFKTNYFFGTVKPGNENLMDSFVFSRESWFNLSELNLHGGGRGCIYDITQMLDRGVDGLVDGFCRVHNAREDVDLINDKYGDILAVMENTQTIYLDVRRVGYVTFDGNNTVVTLPSAPVIQHIELTKNGDVFTFGDSALVSDKISYAQDHYDRITENWQWPNQQGQYYSGSIAFGW
ncbi:MAG: hypothetical protein FWG55_10630 [Candidatus Bathyarchaeota archaeon]|nr:hypothetical protein [Candidatus Termiticorpusculum sp.]